MADGAHSAYTLVPRYVNKRSNKQLSGFAVDLTVRFNKGGAAFLQDHNGLEDPSTYPHNNLDELKDTLDKELTRLYEDHFDG
ncbi:MAG TPA: hypothetical protein VEJ23_10135 [Solirubrobacteraceae bacterium]|nr:hypothetical protein [Solirubrobacteraceae bacterium]